VGPAPPPVEWVDGDSKATFFLGNFLALFFAYYFGSLIGQTAFPFNRDTPLLPLLLQIGVMAAIAVPVNLLYFLSVPCPQRIGISPSGLTVDFGLRKKAYSWSDVHPRTNEALCFAGRNPWSARVALTPYQQRRLSNFFDGSHDPKYAPRAF
jgi:hypothetical protein